LRLPQARAAQHLSLDDGHARGGTMRFLTTVLMLLASASASGQAATSVEKISLDVAGAYKRGTQTAGELRIPDSKRERLPAVVIHQQLARIRRTRSVLCRGPQWSRHRDARARHVPGIGAASVAGAESAASIPEPAIPRCALAHRRRARLA
jgi:hypothetical protein